MTRKSNPAMVPFAVLRKRPTFPNLDQVLEQFISDNDLCNPKTSIDTKSRGIISYWDNGDLINLYERQEDLSGYYYAAYGLQGRIDGETVNLFGNITIPKYPEKNGKKLKKQVHSFYYDEKPNKQYAFLGVKAIPPPDPRNAILR